MPTRSSWLHPRLACDEFHELFGLPDGQRSIAPRNRLDYFQVFNRCIGAGTTAGLSESLARAGLWQRLRSLETVELLCPQSPVDLHRTDGFIDLVAASGDRWRTGLLVGADGFDSPVRALAAHEIEVESDPGVPHLAWRGRGLLLDPAGLRLAPVGGAGCRPRLSQLGHRTRHLS